MPQLQAVRPFASLRREDVAYAGGKGANLGELTSAGLPVPDGFVVGAPAYAAYCAETGLRERIAELLDPLDVEDTTALQAASATARELFDRTPVPAQLQQAIRESYERLAGEHGDAPVAVRSSATGEDTAESSFAGMNETFLNIRGADAVVDAVRRCWRSLFGARTIYYRGVNGLGQAEMDIAVVVQLQLASTRAGVMFTVNPATGQRDELVIEGSFGLGEAVVSGSVSPDRYIVEKATLAIRRREVHHKELVIEYAPDGGTQTRTLSEQEALQPVLSDEEVVAVASLGRQIEQHYGSPQDTEWAFDPDGALWMLQSRPITTLHDDTSPSVAQTTSGEPQAVLLRGLGGAPGSASGPARILASLADAERLQEGDVLVTHMTAPDWLPLMRRAQAIVTDFGRHDLPRGDRLARARHPLHRRHRRGDHQAAQWRDRDGRRHSRDRAGGRPGSHRRAAACDRICRRGGRRLCRPRRHGDADSRQPLRALAGRARQGPARRRRRAAAGRDDGARGTCWRPPAHAAAGGSQRGVRRAHGRGAEHFRDGVRTASGHLPHD